MTGRQIPLITGFIDKLKKLDTYIPIELTLRFFMAFLLSRARIFFDFCPFGIGFTAAAPSGIAGIVTISGSIIGSLSSLDIFWSIKYIAIAIVIRAAIRIFRGTGAGQLDIFPPAVALLSTACIGAVYAADTGWSLTPTVIYVVESFLAGGCAFFYNVALSPWEDSSSGKYGRVCHTIGSVILISTILMSLSTWVLFGVVSIGRFAGVLVMMFATFRGGIGAGCAISTCIGAAMDLSSGAVPFFTMSYAFTAMISGIFSKSSRLLFLLSYITANAIAVVWTWFDFTMLPSLYETFAASVIFMLIPDQIMTRVSALFPANLSGFGFLKAREYTRDRVELASEAFQQLYKTVKNSCGEGTNDNVALIFDRASELVCRSCPRSSKCWQQDYSDTVDIMNNITPLLMKNGAISAGDFPSRFSDSCQRLPQLTAAINAETRTFLCRRQYSSRLYESRGAAYNQYNDISAILHGLSLELGSEVVVEPSLEKKLQKYLRGLNIDASTAVFRVKGGRLRAEIRGNGLGDLRRDKEYLDKLSAVLGTRLCTSENRMDQDRMVLLEAEPLMVSIGSGIIKKAGESVSGDNTSYFRTGEGFLFVLLSDGMGSGQEAAFLSRNTASILENFLKAGISPELTLHILSDLMLLKNDDDISSATIDLLCLNMFSGETRIFKCGAAPSYIKKGSSVRKLSPGASFSLSSSSPKLKLLPGTFAVMVSDGVITGGDKWLRDTISSYQGNDPKELAKSIITNAKEMSDGTDDITVITIKTDERP